MVTIASSTVTSAVTVTNGSWWLKDPTDPALNVAIPVDATSPIAFSRNERVTFHQPIGRSRKVWVADTLMGEEFDLKLVFTDDTTYEAFDAIRSGQRTLLLQSDDEEQWFIRMSNQRQYEYPEVQGRRSGRAVRRLSIRCVEVDPP